MTLQRKRKQPGAKQGEGGTSDSNSEGDQDWFLNKIRKIFNGYR